jgi:hypothetical protein
MPKIKLPPPKGSLNHLVKRFREGRIASADFLELKHWLEPDPEVPDGKMVQAIQERLSRR